MSTRCERGFTVVGMLVLLPTMMSIVMVVAGAMLLLSTDADLKHECRTTLLESQDAIAKDLEQLMQLNDLARSLRDARTAAEAAVRVAILPPARAAASAALIAVKAKQATLAAKQMSLIFSAKAKSRSSPLKAKLKLHRKLRDQSRINGSHEAGLSARLHTADFRVVATPRDSITPDYRPASDFSERQEMKVEVKWSVTTLLPDWLRRWLGRDDLEMTTTCTATIAKGKTGWRSLLKADKS